MKSRVAHIGPDSLDRPMGIANLPPDPKPIPLEESDPELAESIQEFIQYNKLRQSVGLPRLVMNSHGGISVDRREAILAPKVGRNEKCPCGSGNKYKKCCGRWG